MRVDHGPFVEELGPLSANDVLDVEDGSPKRNIAMYIGLGTVILIIVLFLLFRGSL